MPKKARPNLDKLRRHARPRLLACLVAALACALTAVVFGDACPAATLPAGVGVLTSACAAATMLGTYAGQLARDLDRTERWLELEVGTSERLADQLAELHVRARQRQETQPCQGG
jgi:hypothetical protein